jgi:beta-lactamase regulating signal transducer with metallopeptidase domain
MADPAAVVYSQPSGLSNLSLEGAAIEKPSLAAASFARVKPWFLLAAALGSLLILGWSVFHLLRFSRRLAAATTTAPREMQIAAADIARRLDLRKVPSVFITSARISPMVWWMHGRIAVIIPVQLLEELSFKQWQWVLAHELAHVRRRDYLVRWIEWLACLCCWWNPVVWWAQRNLRAAEEICCDALVLSTLKPQPHSYAKSLLTVVEFLAYPVIRPPAMASEINSGGFFLRRCRMIVSNKPNRTNTRWLQALVLLVAVIVLPLGAHLYAKGDVDSKKAKPAVTKDEAKKAGAEKKQSAEEYLEDAWIGLQGKVEAGKLTDGEAKAKYEELKMALHLNSCEGACAKAEFKAAQARMDAELAAGNISKQEMEAMLRESELAIKSRQAEQHEKYLALVKAWDRLDTLISEGMATFEEAVREYEHAKQEVLVASDIYANSGPHYDEAVAEYQAAIRAGTMTHTEAFARLSAVEMAEFSKAFNKTEQMYHEEGIMASLQAMVTRGEITQQEAEAKLQDFRTEMAVKAASDGKEAKKTLTKEEEKQKQQDYEKKQEAKKEKASKEKEKKKG